MTPLQPLHNLLKGRDLKAKMSATSSTEIFALSIAERVQAAMVDLYLTAQPAPVFAG